MPRSAQENGDFEDVRCREDGSARGGQQGLFDCRGLSHVEVGLEPGERFRLGGGSQAAADLFGVRAGSELEGKVAAAGRSAEVGEALDDLGELEDGDALGVHDQWYSGVVSTNAVT